MWRDLSYQWQTVFEEAWKAFGFGSTPIGAALFDKEGQLILSDRNRSHEADTINKEISHAEANALRRMDTEKLCAGKTLGTLSQNGALCGEVFDIIMDM